MVCGDFFAVGEDLFYGGALLGTRKNIQNSGSFIRDREIASSASVKEIYEFLLTTAVLFLNILD
jgi:hypothetical protein